MKIEHLIREQIYLAKRQSRHKTLKRSRLPATSGKKLLGIICVVIGLLLILSKCSLGAKGTASYDVSLSHKLCYAIIKNEENNYENFCHWRSPLIECIS